MKNKQADIDRLRNLVSMYKKGLITKAELIDRVSLLIFGPVDSNLNLH